jgi:amino acid adenylation domain-containing protein
MNTGASLTFTKADLFTTIPARFQQILGQLSPDQLAYISDEETLTYRALSAASQGVAALLIAQVGEGTTHAQQQAVALFLPQCAATLAGIMGVLQAGHFYLPLDSVVGETTLRQILADCPPAAVVTTAALHPQLMALLPAGHKPAIFFIETVAPATIAPETNGIVPETPPDPYRYACLQYTSGSTGRPRGILRTHATILHSGYLAYHDLGFTPGERVSHLLSYAHSFSTPTIFGGLLNGATLYAPPTAVMTANALYQWLAEKQITNVGAAVGQLRGLAELAATHPPLTALRTIGTGGEVMSRTTVEQLCRLLPPTCKLVVRLASTEVGTYARFMIEAGQPWPGKQTPAGYAPPGQAVFIVDEAQQPLAAGELGEIAVRSRFLCAGYWQRPDETAAKFLPDPADSTQKIFLTGDMGRMAADGLVEHVGRKDFMVKIRGYRVQLEEVEAALVALPAISEATVIARATSTGEKQLIAYYTAATTAFPTADALRRALLTTLPDYMLPARFVRLDALPRTAIGKVDRAALPPPGPARPALGTPFVAPRTEQEQQIADLWAELIEVDTVGIDDNFFELGGDSLTLLRMSTLVSERFGYTIPNRYYTMPTIRHLAQGVTEATTDLLATTPTEPAAAPTPQRIDRKQTQVLPYSEGLYPPTRWGKALIQRGPTYAGLKLPYAFGTALQRTIVQQPLIRQHFFSKQCELLGQALREVGLAPQAEAITLNLMANSWKGWRGQALQAPPTFARWVVIKGNEHLKAGLARGNGLIVVFSHQALITHLTRRVLAAHDIQQVPVIAANRPGADGASMAVYGFQHGQEGLALLRHGQAILIAGEGREGTDPVIISLYGRQLPLPRGFAVLAQISQAAVVAAFGSMNTTGHITLEFVPLPTPGPTTAVEDWVEQYGTQLTARWPQLLSMTGWPRLAYLTTLPVQQEP